MGNVVLELSHLTKLYPGVRALDDVSVSFEEGEIHALMGENGAGKSTMIKSIGGAIKPTSGTIRACGKEFSSLTPQLSAEQGIGVIYQEFNLVPSLSVAENVCLGNKLGHKFFKNRDEMIRLSKEKFEEFGVDIDPTEMVSTLSTAKQQLVEIVKSLIKDVKILIMDEPTASLSLAETEYLLDMVRNLKKRGVTIIYVSHRMDEVFAIADRITILRDGKYVDTKKMSEISRKDVIELMVGREVSEDYPTRNVPIGEPVLEARHITGNGDHDISFQLRKGEILGIAGLVGAGRTELAKMIYGALRKQSGEILIEGKPVEITSPRVALDHGIGLIPEDRKIEGCFLEYPIRWNIPITAIQKISDGLFLNRKNIEEVVSKYIDELQVATPSADQLVKNLSGGNQQKIVVAKTLAAQTKIIIFDEPTRGIDVGAKQEIYKLMNRLIENGISIIMISSEMEEVMGMSDRIMVLYEGRMTGMVEKKDFSAKHIMQLASGM